MKSQARTGMLETLTFVRGQLQSIENLGEEPVRVAVDFDSITARSPVERATFLNRDFVRTAEDGGGFA